jgi:DNA-binding IclR family transcriptional regulator
MTAKEIAGQTGRHVSTVRRALNKLWMYGLAAPDGGGLWIAEPAGIDYLQDVAEELGTKGAAEKRRAKHNQEREIWASLQMLRQKERWERRHERREVTTNG